MHSGRRSRFGQTLVTSPSARAFDHDQSGSPEVAREGSHDRCCRSRTRIADMATRWSASDPRFESPYLANLLLRKSALLRQVARMLGVRHV